eukprot:2717927-Pleurochrysis_carterae.AAC.3
MGDTDIKKVIGSLKYKVRKLMLTMTKEYTTKNSSNFWRRIFPITRGRKGIIKINKVNDWTNPPTKNTLTPSQTQEIAKEASKYYEYLYSPQQGTNQTSTAKQRLLKRLREWGVEKATSQLAGEDISTDEINKAMTILPKGKAPGLVLIGYQMSCTQPTQT